MLNVDKIKPKIIHACYPPSLKFTEDTGKAHNHQMKAGTAYYPPHIEIERALYNLDEASIHPAKSYAIYRRSLMVIKI